MPVLNLALSDREIAAAVFRQHLEQLWAGGRPANLGWERQFVDPLRERVMLPAQRPTGEIDSYYVLLDAKYYDLAPPVVWIVHPETLAYATPGTKYFPRLEGLPPWFQLHSEYPWPDGKRQLVCFSMNAEFYLTDHSPKESEKWKQGRHTLAAPLFRLAEILSPKYYRGPSA